MSTNVSAVSPFYPYVKVIHGAADFTQHAAFPKKIINYLIDPPDPASGYMPPDDNSFPRCRFWKYLLYDGARPLDKPLPDVGTKMGTLFDPAKPDLPDSPLGYRLYAQQYVMQAQPKAASRVFVYMGRTIKNTSTGRGLYIASVIFDVITHYTLETNMQTDQYSRSDCIVCELINALDGVNMTGVGTFSLDKSLHPDAGTSPVRDNENVGQRLVLGLEMCGESTVSENESFNMPFAGADGAIRLA